MSSTDSMATDQEKQLRPPKNNSASTSAAVTFPEGGRAGWLTVLGSLSVLLLFLPHQTNRVQCAHPLLDLWRLAIVWGAGGPLYCPLFRSVHERIA